MPAVKNGGSMEIETPHGTIFIEVTSEGTKVSVEAVADDAISFGLEHGNVLDVFVERCI